MSSFAHVLIKRQELAQLSTVDDIFAHGDVMGDLLALAEGSSAVGIVRDSFAHLVLGQQSDQDKFRVRR
jgi:hypothetical protein